MGTSKLKWVPPRKKWVVARNVGSSKDWVVTSLRSAQSHKIFLFQGQRQKPKQIKTKQCLGWDRSNSKSDLNTYKVLATYYVYKIHTSIYSTKVNEVTNFSSSYIHKCSLLIYFYLVSFLRKSFYFHISVKNNFSEMITYICSEIWICSRTWPAIATELEKVAQSFKFFNQG